MDAEFITESGYMKMKKIPSETEIYPLNMTESSGVYVGSLAYMEWVNNKLEWRQLGDDEYRTKVLTLKEIAEQLQDAWLITVVVERPSSGEIYQYGNYADDEWWQIGTLDGYA